jgi:hypothetical protein
MTPPPARPNPRLETVVTIVLPGLRLMQFSSDDWLGAGPTLLSYAELFKPHHSATSTRTPGP